MLAVLVLQTLSTKRRIALKRRASSTEIPTENKFCRTCLSTEDLSPIFSKESDDKRSHDLELVTGLEIKMNDGLSQRICSQCTEAIKSSLQFRRTCKKTERALRGMVNEAAPKVKTEMEVDVEPLAEEYDYGADYGVDFQDYSCEDERPTVIKKRPQCKTGSRRVTCREIPLTNPDEDSPEESQHCRYINRRYLSEGRKKRDGRRGPGAGFKCGTCHKEFRMEATYKSHMRFHTNFCVCEACGKRFRNNHQLREHKRARHGLGRIHKCAFCDYSSATKEALTIHERRHTGERPYVCDHCGAAFHRRSNLVQHIAIHLTDKNWQCDMCPKRLKSKKFLQIHKHTAHTGKRYGFLCAVCAQRFDKPNKVRAHARRVHGIPDDQQAPMTRVQL